MKENSHLPNIISKLQGRISLHRLIAWNGVTSLFVFMATQKNIATWPMIDLIPHLQRLENNNSMHTNTDYFSNSQLSHSGRAPFVFTSHFILLITRISPETYLALLSSALIAIGPTLVLITFIQARKKIILERRFFTILDCFVLIFMQYFLAHYAPRLALAGYSSIIFTQGMVPATLSITLAAVGIIGFTNIKISYLKYLFTTILYLAIIIHPATSLMFLIFWVILKILHRNFESLKLVIWPLVLGGLTEILLSRSDISRMTGFEFTQIYSNLRHPHHYWPSYFYSEIFIEYFIIALTIVAFLRFVCRLGQPFKHSLILFFYVFIIFIFQYLLVEVYAILQVAQLSITRGFVYIGFAFCTYFYWIYEDLLLKIRHTSSIGYAGFKVPLTVSKYFSTFIVIPIFSLLFFTTTSNALSEFHSLRKNVVIQMHELGIQPTEKVLLDINGVDSSGWREYGSVNIWLDSYFPFDMKSISEYRQRWLKLCGPNRMINCDFSENRLSKVRFWKIIKDGDIDVIVWKKGGTNFNSFGWKRTGESNLYESYRRV